MKEENNSVDSLIALITIFKESTDKSTPAKLNRLGVLVSEKLGRKKPVDPRTIKKNIDLLKRLGFDIEKTVGGYFLEKRFLDRSETKLLCDQILFSTIIPATRKEKIIKGLISDFSENDQNALKSNISVDYKAKKTNELYKGTLSNTKTILEAIEENKKITFKYGDYNENKILIPKDKKYKVSPYEFIFEQGKYYIMCQNEEDEGTNITRNYRIDLMTEVRKSLSNRVEIPIEENLTDYCLRQVNMFSADNIEIVMRLNTLGLRGLYDKLGFDTKIRVKKIDEGLYEAKFNASFMGTKYFALQYLEQCEIIKPSELRKEIKKSIRSAIDKYE